MQDKFFLDTRDPDILEKLSGLYAAVNGQDPLPCALICAAYIDKLLLGILESTLRSGTTAEGILRQDTGLLGSLYARARILYLMNIIDKFTYKNIEYICRIRNLFAHSHEPLSFDSAAVIKECTDLKFRNPKDFEVSEGDSDALANMKRVQNEPKFKFIHAALGVVTDLLDITARLIGEPPKSIRVDDPLESP